MTRSGYEVDEAARMDARTHRGTGKSDPLDARRIAAAVLSLERAQLRRRRSDEGVRAALLILTTDRPATIDALIALLRVVDLGIDARKPLTAKQINEVARWRARAEELALPRPVPRLASGFRLLMPVSRRRRRRRKLPRPGS